MNTAPKLVLLGALALAAPAAAQAQGPAGKDLAALAASLGVPAPAPLSTVAPAEPAMAGILPPSVFMYHWQEHFQVTAYLALQAGFAHEEAAAIAFQDAYTDHDPAKRPGPVLTDFIPVVGGITALFGARAKYHFTSESQRARLRAEAFAPRNLGSFEPLGVYLHALQDSFSHALWERRGGELVRAAPFEPLLGHVPRGRAPDIPSLALGTAPGDRAEDRIDVAVLMAQATFTELREYLGAWRPGSLSTTTFADIRPVVQRALGVDYLKVPVSLGAALEARLRDEAAIVFQSEHGGHDLLEMRRVSQIADKHYEMILERLTRRELAKLRDAAYHEAVRAVLFPAHDGPEFRLP